MDSAKLPLQENLMIALRALPQDDDMKHTVNVLDTLAIPDQDYVNVLMFIEILLGYRMDLNEQFKHTQLLMELHKECLQKVKNLRLK